MDDVLKAYAGVVNDLVCTQFAQEVVIAWRCGCNNMCSGPVGQLHGKDADASRRTMNQDGLPRRQFGVIKESLPRCQGCQRHGCRLSIVEGARFRSTFA